MRNRFRFIFSCCWCCCCCVVLLYIHFRRVWMLNEQVEFSICTVDWCYMKWISRNNENEKNLIRYDNDDVDDDDDAVLSFLAILLSLNVDVSFCDHLHSNAPIKIIGKQKNSFFSRFIIYFSDLNFFTFFLSSSRFHTYKINLNICIFFLLLTSLFWFCGCMQLSKCHQFWYLILLILV